MKQKDTTDRGRSFKKARHLHMQVRNGGKYANKPLPPLQVDESTARVAKGGIQISTGARKLIDVLAMLLHEQSEKRDGLEAYTGKNKDGTAISYSKDKHGTAIQHRLPIIETTAYQLARHYEGTEPSGRSIERVRAWMHELASVNHVIRYDRKDGREVVGTVDAYLPIIHLMLQRDTGQGEKYVLQLNPIFRDQIANQFILLPDDYAARLHEAFGGKPSKAAMGLFDYIILKLSFEKGRTYAQTLSLLKAAEIMGIPPTQIKKKPWAVTDQVSKAFGTAQRMGLITNAKIDGGLGGFNDIKITFYGPVQWY